MLVGHPPSHLIHRPPIQVSFLILWWGWVILLAISFTGLLYRCYFLILWWWWVILLAISFTGLLYRYYFLILWWWWVILLAISFTGLLYRYPSSSSGGGVSSS